MNSGKIVLAGGSGFLGQILAKYFLAKGRDVIVLTRNPKPNGAAARQVQWDATTVGEWTHELEGADAVINLTGRTVNCRYNAQNRREILESRVNSTRVMGEAIRQCANSPHVWLNASTATIYKHTFGPAHDERGEIGATTEARDEFSVEVARAWEKALEEAMVPGVRKVAFRAAMVLGTGENSVFPTLRRLARLGLGGRMGSGRQFVSWIHEWDFCRAIEWILEHGELSGPVNVAAPNPVMNAEMMRALRKAVGAPFGLPAFQWMLEIGAVVMRTEVELMIKSRRVIPARLLETGFKFEFNTIAEAFEDLAKDNRPTHPNSRSTRD